MVEVSDLSFSCIEKNLPHCFKAPHKTFSQTIPNSDCNGKILKEVPKCQLGEYHE